MSLECHVQPFYVQRIPIAPDPFWYIALIDIYKYHRYIEMKEMPEGEKLTTIDYEVACPVPELITSLRSFR